MAGQVRIGNMSNYSRGTKKIQITMIECDHGGQGNKKTSKKGSGNGIFSDFDHWRPYISIYIYIYINIYIYIYIYIYIGLRGVKTWENPISGGFFWGFIGCLTPMITFNHGYLDLFCSPRVVWHITNQQKFAVISNKKL